MTTQEIKEGYAICGLVCALCSYNTDCAGCRCKTGDYDRCKTVDEVMDLLRNGKPDPYQVCPTYESIRFILRLVSVDDAADLLACYSSPEAQRFFNYNNCVSDCRYTELSEMLWCINFWLEEYQNKKYVRFSIIDKQSGKSVGTVEIFGSGHRGHSVLRIDILPEFEKADDLGELLQIADLFFYDFGCERIVTKAIPEAEKRILALTHHGYSPYPANDEWEREDYFIKMKY